MAEKTLATTQHTRPSKPSPPCPSWMNHPMISSRARRSTAYPLERPQDLTASPLMSSTVPKAPCWGHYTNYSVSAGRKVKCHKKGGTVTLSRSIRTRGTGVTVTTTAESPSPSEYCLQGLCSCGPQQIDFINLTKAFDLVSRDGLFRILSKIACPPKSLGIFQSFHTNMKGLVQFDGASSVPFSIRNGVKKGCVPAPTLFGIFFAVMIKQGFGTSKEGVYLHTRSDGMLFNLARLKAKTKIRKTVIRDMLFADDAALVSHTEQQLQDTHGQLLSCQPGLRDAHQY